MENRIIALCHFKCTTVSSQCFDETTGTNIFCQTCMHAEFIPDPITRVLYLPIATSQESAPERLGDIIEGHIKELLVKYCRNYGPSTWTDQEGRTTHSLEIQDVKVAWGSHILDMIRDMNWENLAATLEMIKLRGYKDSLTVTFGLRHHKEESMTETAATEAKERDIDAKEKDTGVKEKKPQSKCEDTQGSTGGTEANKKASEDNVEEKKNEMKTKTKQENSETKKPGKRTLKSFLKSDKERQGSSAYSQALASGGLRPL